jgi:DcuC family C4-dicarboxylate transporter
MENIKLGIVSRIKVYSAPVLLFLSFAVSSIWKKIHVVNIDISMLSFAMLCGSVILICLHGRRGRWWMKWRKTLPSLIFVVLPILGYTEIISKSDSNKELANFVLGPLSSVGIIAIVLVTLTTFVVNISLVSANASALVVGPVAFTTLSAIGIKPEFAAASVLVGTWGAVCSFGSSQASLIATLSQVNVRRVVVNHIWVALLGLVVVGSTLFIEVWILSGRNNTPRPRQLFHPSVLLATLPLFPLILLLVKPIADRILKKFGEQLKVKLPMYTSIGMILSSFLAVAIIKLPLITATKIFGLGVADGFVKVVVLIAAALIFVDALEITGWVKKAVGILGTRNPLVPLFGMGTAMFCAVFTGSSDAPVSGLNTAFVGEARILGLDALKIGSLTWFGGEMGRCFSPVAAVTLSLGKIVHIESSWLIAKCCFLPMLLSAVTVFMAFRNKKFPATSEPQKLSS